MNTLTKKIVMFVCAALSAAAVFGQEILGTSYLKNPNSPIYESVAVVGVVDDGSGMDYNTFASDISNSAINIAMLEQLRKAELSRLLAPYSGIRVESIILNNRRVVMNHEKKSAQIFYYHPDPTLAQRLANLFAREFVAYCQSLNAQDLTAELQKYEAIRKKLDAETTKVSESLTRYYERVSISGSTVVPPQAKLLDELLAKKEKLMSIIADTKQKIRETPAGVKVLRSATNPKKPKNKQVK